MERMAMQFTDVGGVTKAVLGGRLKSTAVERVQTDFIDHIVPREQPAVVDMSEVLFIGSVGIRMLLNTAQALNRNGTRLALFGANDEVMEIIETTAVGEIILVVDTEAEAVAAVTA